MLLTRMRGVVSTSETPLRGLFEPNDAWVATGDLFRADEDGDLWLVDNVATLIRTAHGHVASFPIVDALGDVDAIDLAVAYGVAPEPGARPRGCGGHGAAGVRPRARRTSPTRSRPWRPTSAPTSSPSSTRSRDHLVSAEYGGAAERRNPSGAGVWRRDDRGVVRARVALGGYDRSANAFDYHHRGDHLLPIADFGLGEALLTTLSIFFFVIWIWILITILSDLFRDHEMSGWGKAAWSSSWCSCPS